MTTAELLQQGTDWQAWSKPAGWTVHNESPSLLEFLKKKNPSGEMHFLNRLDKDTSGIVIVATKTAAVEGLQKIWNSEQTHKVYVGIHRRRRSPAIPAEEIWNESLSDRSEGRNNPRGLAKDRVPCLTHMHLLEEGPHLVLTALILATGRQHQIRRHSVLHKMELIGDERYGERDYNLKLKSHMPDLRLGLHAFALLWTVHGTRHEIVCPLPDFFLSGFPQAPEKFLSFVRNDIFQAI